MSELIQTLWVGPRLSAMERLALTSFVQNNHRVHLYTYGPVSDVPSGVAVRDGNEILPQSMIFLYRDHRSYSGFSNYFRYKLLLDRGGCWADSDLVALQPFDFEEPYVFSSEPSPRMPVITSSFIKAPAGCDAMRHAWEVCAGKDRTQIRWGETGPALLGEVVDRFALQRFVMPPEVFCPVGYREVERLFEADPPPLPRATRAVHLWNEMWRRAGRDKDSEYDPRCLYERLKSRYGVRTERRSFAEPSSR